MQQEGVQRLCVPFLLNGLGRNEKFQCLINVNEGSLPGDIEMGFLKGCILYFSIRSDENIFLETQNLQKHSPKLLGS